MRTADQTKSIRQVAWRILLLILALCISCGESGGPVIGGTSPEGEEATVTLNARPNDNPQYWGSLVVKNSGSREAELMTARLTALPKGLRLVGFALLVPGENDASRLLFECGDFPPSNWATHELKGFRLKAGAYASILVAVRPLDKGVFTADGIELTYRIGDSQYTRRLKARAKIISTPTRPLCTSGDKQDHRR